MKILQVVTSLSIGGAEKLVLQLIKELRYRNIQTDLCIFDSEETPFLLNLEEFKKNENNKLPELKIYKLGYGYYNLKYISKLRKIMKNYDIIHSHNSSCQLFTAIANIGLNKKIITTEHNTDNRKRHYPLIRFIDLWMYKRYNKIISISPDTERNLKTYISPKKNNDSRYITIYNGIDITTFKNAKQIIELKQSDKFTIIMVGAFRAQKDQRTLIKSIGYLDDKYVLWLVGEGKYLNEIKTWTETLNYANRISFLGTRDDVPNLLKTADIVVMSSHWEGFGLAAVEGMAAGKPIVASNVDGLSQIVQNAGLLFTVGNAKELADKIRELSENALYYEKIASQCEKRANDYDFSKMLNAYIEVYQQVLRPHI